MKIELGDVKELAQMVKVGVGVIQELNKDGTLSQIGEGLASIRAKFREQSAELDVAQYLKYVTAGISAEQAVLLMATGKLKWKLDLDKLLFKK